MPKPPAGFVELTDPGAFLAHVGPLYIRRSGDDSPVLGLCAADEHCNASRAVHGGLLASLCDSACGQTIRARADDGISGAVTISLTVDYLAPSKRGDWLECERGRGRRSDRPRRAPERPAERCRRGRRRPGRTDADGEDRTEHAPALC